MEKIALITGASGGIGLELATLFAQDKTNLLLIARNEAKLREIKQILEKQYPIKVYLVATDLSVIEGLHAIQDFVTQNNLQVEYLVNNAGFGDYGAFVERSIEKFREMISLNISMLVELTYHFAQKMKLNGSGKILNVASTSGFQPDPYFAVYGASKAFVINFTEALHKELEKAGVSATIISPGPTATGFTDKADMEDAKLYKSGVMNAKDVAVIGYKAMHKGKLHVIPGLRNKVMATLSSIMPSGYLRLNLAAKIMEREN